eukprot:Protomagalhaensia_sp_Gyna_25__861@NODE_1416_length_1856_cov_6_002752_g1142_i0_p1_GENE_NODE_1416_length_1856_cov_6_002752_g1142_i0NODE_1416_length_1856_cov_6_002752_g1142_i0_p1_ORF_typecomplete_len585_score87_26Alphaamylase/PF00128_24/2_9e44Alphaamylase/PF00128_24/6_3e03hDGE_amylase/PF14701_6/7_9e05hDGE_amylase/PF14701_6/3_7e02Glyco_hydro_70/PF02324_16/0_22Glyco_hydro_70/PF02324_16/22Melibiase/PF02065_18/0_034Cellulase/PF00150_18/0_026Alphaamylase_C/PF02806_18/0_04_NODE_1416_length_1856_cov_6_002
MMAVWNLEYGRVCLSNGRVFELTPSPKPEIFKADVPASGWQQDTAVTYHYEFEPSWNDCFHSEGSVIKRRDPYARYTDFETDECYIPLWESHKLCPKSPFFDSTDKRPQWDNAAINIYELHVGSFQKGPCEGASSCFDRIPLQHIENLGFNTVELMPVQEFGGHWGYNPRLLMAIHSPFGTPSDLRRFITNCHQKGIKVVLDLVLNHGSAKRNSLWNFDGYGPDNCGGIYFEGGKETGWGRQFNFRCSQVLWYIRHTCSYFLKDMNADGIRFDSVHNMEYSFTKDLIRELRNKYPDRIFIAEVTPEDPRACKDQSFDSVWVHSNYYDTIKLFRDRGHSYDLTLLFNIINGNPHFSSGLEMVSSILGSHDQVGNRHNGHSDDDRIGRYMVDQLGGRNNWHARAQCRMLFAVQALGRQIPMVFQGTEILQGRWWNIDTDHHWDQALVSNRDLHSIQFMEMVHDVNRIRASTPSLQAISEQGKVCHQDGVNLVAGVARGNDLIITHWSNNQWEREILYGVQTPWSNRELEPIFNSQAEEYGGWEESWSSTKSANGEGRTRVRTGGDGILRITLPKWSTMLFRLAYPE